MRHNKRTSNLSWRRFIGVVILITAGSSFAQNSPQRITFARGATVARATGYLRGVRDSAWFVLRAGAGQHMRLEIDGRGATRGMLVYPSGKQDGQPGGLFFDDTFDETGDYKIGVTESSMANAWRGNFTLKIEVLPRGQANSGALNLEKYVGKYPSELFRQVPSIKTRLRTLLGTNYKAFTDRMQTETPIEKDGDALVMRGCMAHSCTIEEAILVIDTNDNNKLYVALRFNGKFSKTFPPKAQLPDALKRAMKAD